MAFVFLLSIILSTAAADERCLGIFQINYRETPVFYGGDYISRPTPIDSAAITKAEALILADPGGKSNCFDAVARFHGIKKKPENMDEDQVVRMLRKHFRQLEKDETPQPGDVITVWRNSIGPWAIDTNLNNGYGLDIRHAAIYLGGDKFFEKFGQEPTDPYSFPTFRGVIQYYIDHPSRPTGGSPLFGEPDGPVIVYFRKNPAQNP